MAYFSRKGEDRRESRLAASGGHGGDVPLRMPVLGVLSLRHVRRCDGGAGSYRDRFPLLDDSRYRVGQSGGVPVDGRWLRVPLSACRLDGGLPPERGSYAPCLQGPVASGGRLYGGAGERQRHTAVHLFPVLSQVSMEADRPFP